MVGGKGTNLDVFGGNLGTFGAGGGGGTGIAYRDATTNDWKLLMVAAGGGGSGWSLLNGTLSGISGQGYLSGNEGSGKGEVPVEPIKTKLVVAQGLSEMMNTSLD